MKIKKILILLILFGVVFFLSDNLSAQRTKSSQNAGEQRKSEKGLKDNRYFFYFINYSVTNFSDEADKDIFKEAVRRDMISQMLYLKFMFHDSFVEIRSAQSLLIKLYKKILLEDIKRTKELLNEFAPKVIMSNNIEAKEYLRLGYRDVAVAKQYMIMADNYRNVLYSLRLFKYVKAIKKAKHGKRYAVLAKLEINPIEKSLRKLKEDIIKLRTDINSTRNFSDERVEAKKRLYIAKMNLLQAKKKIGELSFDEIKELIKKIPDATEDRKKYYILMHYDNFYKTKEKISCYEKVWENPELEKIKEFKEYLKKN